MPTARILIWSLVAFLAMGAVWFAVQAARGIGLLAAVRRAWRNARAWRAARRERMALAFDPMRSAPRSKVLPEAKAFFAARRLGNSESGAVGKSNTEHL